jgi:hypothetical protein
MFTKHDPIQGGFNGYSRYDQALTYQTGSWSLDPLAPQVPEPGLVQMFLNGQPVKKEFWRCRSSKAVPSTAKFASRHGNIQAKFRVVGDSAVRSIATIRAESRRGNITLDVVSYQIVHQIPLF